MQDFHQLNVWKKAHELVLRVYRTTNEFPSNENFGLVLTFGAALLRLHAVSLKVRDVIPIWSLQLT